MGIDCMNSDHAWTTLAFLQPRTGGRGQTRGIESVDSVDADEHGRRPIRHIRAACYNNPRDGLRWRGPMSDFGRSWEAAREPERTLKRGPCLTDLGEEEIQGQSEGCSRPLKAKGLGAPWKRQDQQCTCPARTACAEKTFPLENRERGDGLHEHLNGGDFLPPRSRQVEGLVQAVDKTVPRSFGISER